MSVERTGDSSPFASARQQSVGGMLRRSASKYGAKTAIICGDVTWTYTELDAKVDQLAAGLAAWGIQPGDRVAVLARNSHAFVQVRFAVARIGAVFVPINFMLNEESVSYVLDHSGSRILFVDPTTAHLAEAASRHVEAIFSLPGEDSPAVSAEGLLDFQVLHRDDAPLAEQADAMDVLQIIYTSGTESRPKGAVLTHAAVLWQYQSCIAGCEWSHQTVALHALPLFHCAQLDGMLGPSLSVGAVNVITSKPSPENLLRLLVRHGVTSFFAPPTVWIALLRSELFGSADLSVLRRGYYGASIMPVEVLRELMTRMPQLRLWNLYGQTEIAPLATILNPEDQVTHSGSVGRPALHVQTRLVDDEMRDVAVGEVGEVVHRSPQLMSCYWNDEKRTAEAFAGGWFHSGDLAIMDADGYITIVDRKKDMIKTGGENVSSREVEEVLYSHPAVSEAAVIGLPHPIWIEAITAVVVLRDGITCEPSELLKHCMQSLEGFKMPKNLVFRSELPKNASGKILKRDLRIHLEADSGCNAVEEKR